MRAGLVVRMMVWLGFAAVAGVLACTSEEFAPFAACDFDNDASAGVQGGLTKRSGDGLTRAAGTHIDLAVLLRDVDGEGLCEKTITWSPGAGSGSVSPLHSITDDSGTTGSVWTLGPAAGTQTATATVESSIPPLSVTFTVTATPAESYSVNVTVAGSGSGAGHVSSTDAGMSINCDFPSATTCAATLPAGSGGSFNLVATPAVGSTFMGWTGCPSASSNVCTISYPAGEASVFAVTARFDGTAGTQDSLSLYNGTASTVNMVVGSETPGVANGLMPSAHRDVLIPTAIGTAVSVRAYIGGEQVASTACTVTAAAWQGALKPNVGLSIQAGGIYVLTCYNF